MPLSYKYNSGTVGYLLFRLKNFMREDIEYFLFGLKFLSAEFFNSRSVIVNKIAVINFLLSNYIIIVSANDRLQKSVILNGVRQVRDNFTKPSTTFADCFNFALSVEPTTMTRLSSFLCAQLPLLQFFKFI